MTEINTFSAAVDDTISRVGRPDRKSDAVSFVRTTVRELQVLAKFQKDFVEDQLTANADPFIWKTPQEFRSMWTVSYPHLVDGQGKPVFPRPIRPGRLQRHKRYFYYASGDSYVFKGHGGGSTTQPINIAYHAYARKLPFYDLAVPETVRPARFILEDNAWEYADAFDDNDVLKEQARELVTNWVLFNWFDAVVEGAMAKLLKTTGDERAVSSFALFSSYKKDLEKAEAKSVQGGEV